MTDRLALDGGTTTITEPFRLYNTIGDEEIQAVTDVMKSGVLSRFTGTWGPDFLGGPTVREFESAWAEFFGVKHAIATNSWTSGLVAAVGALDVEPGDEIIVSPWTMTASAIAILHWNCVPVFADIEPGTFCIDVASVESRISSRTRAIISVDIFGQSADVAALKLLAEKYDLKIISDTAQAPSALYQGGYAGTQTDVGGFSLNRHKHIHTGEGGVLVTDDDHLAERMQLIRNHAEAVVGPMGVQTLNNMLGHNFRLGEIEAAIGIEQLKRLPGLVASRQRIAEEITEGLADIPGLTLPVIRDDATHVFYFYPIVLDRTAFTADRATLQSALFAEGIRGVSEGYINLHMLPMYQRKIAYGSSGFPWVPGIARSSISYEHGICPIAEKLHEDTFMKFEMCKFQMSNQETQLLVQAMRKVFTHFLV